MIAVVDSSVVLRLLFGEPEPLASWTKITEAFASRLMPLEVRRVVDRRRLAGAIDDDDVVHVQQELRRVLRSFEIIAVSEPILERAEGAMPTAVGSLDAIHLATAIEIGRHLARPMVVATHDDQLARVARASGLDVVGA
jgi:predicted nucleic acid-binding protein